ncbi:MAG: ATP-binding protein [Deltaproteobacteria bacterium]|nr:ATP-binding protein [Deltaproteobacteria bacterium]
MIDLNQSLRRLGMRASEEAINGLIKHAHKGKLSPEVLIEKLVEIELRERDVRNLARRTRDASLGRFKTMDQFDWAHLRKVDRPLIEGLLMLDFLVATPPANILLRGPAGVGKTTIAQNIGLAALEAGHTVRFSTLPATLADLLRQESLPAIERRMKRYTAPDLLILDELGYVPCDSRAADLFFNIISRRHEVRSVVITTNLPFKSWGDVFPAAACLGALIDRFAENCHVVDLDADSYRQRSAKDSRRKAPVPQGRSPVKQRLRPQ